MKKLFSLFLALTLLCAAAIPAMAEETDRAAALRASFLAKADEVVVTDDSVIFPDAASETPLEIAKNPSKPAVLYGSFVTLWYEAGGKAGIQLWQGSIAVSFDPAAIMYVASDMPVSAELTLPGISVEQIHYIADCFGKAAASKSRL